MKTDKHPAEMVAAEPNSLWIGAYWLPVLFLLMAGMFFLGRCTA